MGSRRPELMGPPESLYVIASDRADEVMEVEINHLRLKMRCAERALNQLYRVLRPWPGARQAMLHLFPEAAEAPV